MAPGQFLESFSCLNRSDHLLECVSIALVGKYTKLTDCYASVIKALEHSALAINHKLEVKVWKHFTLSCFENWLLDLASLLCSLCVDCFLQKWICALDLLIQFLFCFLSLLFMMLNDLPPNAVFVVITVHRLCRPGDCHSARWASKISWGLAETLQFSVSRQTWGNTGTSRLGWYWKFTTFNISFTQIHCYLCHMMAAECWHGQWFTQLSDTVSEDKCDL